VDFSVIISTHNDLSLGILGPNLRLMSRFPNLEILVVDNHSTDGTKELCDELGVEYFSTNANSRAERLNIGIKKSKHEWIFILHPRTKLRLEALVFLLFWNEKKEWGVFTHSFDKSHPLLTFTSWWSNQVRGDIKGIYYFDHCFVVKKSLLEKAGLVPEMDIFEDTELSLNLLKHRRPHRIPLVLETSAIRFEKNGVFKQALLNQYLKWAYYFHSSDKKMNELYEKNLELNSKL